MSLRKVGIIGSIALLALGLSACKNSQPKSYSGQSMTAQNNKITKKQALQIMAKGYKSGQVTQKFEMTNDVKGKEVNQLIQNQVIFGGQPMVMQINNQTKAGKKGRAIGGFLDQDTIYLAGKNNKNYKTSYKNMTGHTYADLIDTLINNYNITNPDKALTNAESLENNNSTYVLAGQITNQKLMKQTADKIVRTLPMAKQQGLVLTTLLRYSKFKQMTVKTKFKDKQMVSYNETVIAILPNKAQINISQSYNNFNRFNNIKLPDTITKAKPLPKSPIK